MELLHCHKDPESDIEGRLRGVRRHRLSDRQGDGLRLQLGPETMAHLAPEVTYPQSRACG